jgi:hypothetical protein
VTHDACFSARILVPLFAYLSQTRGEAAVSAVVEQPGVGRRVLDRYAWLTHPEFEAALGAARAALEDDDEFQLACRHELGRSYGPIAFVVRAISVVGVYKLLARTSQLVTRASRFEITDVGESRVWMRYTSPFRESRLMCLSRTAQLTRVPALFGHPAAEVEERRCLARGDRSCEYVIRW